MAENQAPAELPTLKIAPTPAITSDAGVPRPLAKDASPAVQKLSSSKPEDRDWGFGTKVASETPKRLVNRDGSFNMKRLGLSSLGALSPYHALITMPWPRYALLLISSYFTINAVFAVGYLLCGDGALQGTLGRTTGEKLLEMFFFSIQTFTTVGYGRINPMSLSANLLVSVQFLVGLLWVALSTGLFFARFSRPQAKILFSNQAVLAPYRGITAFMFRIVNKRQNELIDVNASLTLNRLETKDGKTQRVFYPLTLERDHVQFFPLHWVLVHPIDEQSPLYRISREAFEAVDSEILISLQATDETFSQMVYARSSYKHHEVAWGAKFANIFAGGDQSGMSIDIRRLHDIEQADLTPPPPSLAK